MFDIYTVVFFNITRIRCIWKSKKLITVGEVYFKFILSVENNTSAKYPKIPGCMLQTSRELPGDGMVSHDGARRRSA